MVRHTLHNNRGPGPPPTMSTHVGPSWLWHHRLPQTSHGGGRAARIQGHPGHPSAGSVPTHTAMEEQQGPWPPLPPPPPTRLLSPTPWPLGRSLSPRPGLQVRLLTPGLGCSQEGTTEPTVHWAPRPCRSSQKGSGWGGLLGVLSAEWGPKQGSLGLSHYFRYELYPLKILK